MGQAFRPIRRDDRTLDNDDALFLLDNGIYGILSANNPKGWPCEVPLSYVVLNGDICIHCASQGEKLDLIALDNRVTFCVVGRVQAAYDKNFGTRYESVVIHGTALRVEEPAGKRDILMALAQKYLPDEMNKAPDDISHGMDNAAIFRITPVHVTGKAKR